MVEHNPKLEKEAGQSKVNVAANSAHAKKYTFYLFVHWESFHNLYKYFSLHWFRMV